LPTTLFALILFICFVTPGFIFEMLRERHRPSRSYSVLRETSIIVVSSVAFALPAILILVELHTLHFPGFPDLQQLAEQPAKYSATHLTAVVWLIVGSVFFAVMMAVALDLALQRKQPARVVTREPAWSEVLIGKARPPDKEAAIVTIELMNGASIGGAVHSHGLNNNNELDWIVLQRHPKWPLKVRARNGKVDEVNKDWAYYMVPAAQIRVATVAYLNGPPK
jgi:hypothetical protein